MADGMRLDGFAELERKLLDLGVKHAARAIRKAAREGAKPILRRAKATVPKNTGNLRSKLGIRAVRRKRNGEYRVRIGTKRGDGAAYGVPVEYGTDDMAARPFLRNSLAAAGAEALQRTKEELGKQLDLEFKKRG